MGYAIMLRLEPDLDRHVRNVWKAMESAGIGKTPGQLGEPPHVSISDMAAGSPDRLWEAATRTLFRDMSLTLIPFGMFFGAKHTMYFNVAASEGFQESHLIHYEHLSATGVEFNPLYAPGQILLHCTIAVEIEKADLERAVNLISKSPGSIRGRVIAVEMWEYFPARMISRMDI
jgi:hypothetical protein